MNTTDLERDARNRALRTFLQGLGIDVLAAVALVLLNAASSANQWSDLDWATLGFLLAKTVATTAASYVMRKYLDGSALPTPLPPSDPGEPADPEQVPPRRAEPNPHYEPNDVDPTV